MEKKMKRTLQRKTLNKEENGIKRTLKLVKLKEDTNRTDNQKNFLSY